MPDAPRFIHLRNRSAYSLLEGAIPIPRLIALARAAAMPAVAITDRNNLFGALEFSEAAVKAGIQPILGCQLMLAIPETDPGRRPALRPLVLLAQNAQGWQNLMALSSSAYLDCGPEEPHLGFERLAAHAEGLICLTGGPDGPLGAEIAAGRPDRADILAKRLDALFPGRLYVELQRHPTEDAPLTEAEAATEPGLVALAHDCDLPLVATNDVHFAAPEDHAAQDALLCIADGTYVDQAEPRRRLTPAHHFRDQDAMAALFADIPEAVENTVEIARRCAFRVPKRKEILPRFAADEVEELRAQARAGLEARLAVIPHAAPVADYRARLDYELRVIEQMGFPGYFLIVADFIKWAKAQGIPVGPGRGSGAGSLVAYALTITDLDPLRYGLLFERFLNPERISMPDFDIDFCMDRREEVIAYVRDRYGADRVAHIITFGAMLSKAAVRDVGRVLQMPYGQVDRLAKLIPVEGVKPVSVARALAEEPRLAEEARREPQVARLLEIATAIEGLYRNASTHAAGVVIGDRPLTELVPLYRDPRAAMPATQFNMKWVEQAGLVKFDFLGLKTLTVIEDAVAMLRRRGVMVDMAALPLDDPETFALYASAETAAVFQVESKGMRDALRKLRPDCIEDIIALVALYRPGPMDNIDKFCAVKHGREKRESLHPLIDPILDETQGIIVYQEQVMEIARKMAGYSLGGADLLRRAMGKKDKAAMDREKPKFLDGAQASGVDPAKAGEVWDLLEKFANYGFNKSHAAAYAVVSYQTAWLKAHHPLEFLAAVMNGDIHLTDKLALYRAEAARMGLAIAPPCVNRSGARFTVEDGQILYALGALKGVGVEAMGLIVAARGAVPFRDLIDLAERVDLRRIGKRALEMLARAGAFDALEPNRHRAFAAIDRLIAHSGSAHDDRASAQQGLFGAGPAALPPPRLPAPPDWHATERLAAEHEAVGFYLSGHPLDAWRSALGRMRVMTYQDLMRMAAHRPVSARVAGTLATRRDRKSARGTRYAFLGFSEPTGHFEVMAFADVLEPVQDALVVGANMLIGITTEDGAEGTRLRAVSIQPLEAAIARAPVAGLRLRVATPEALIRVQAAMTDTACRRDPRGPVSIVLAAPDLDADVELALPNGSPVGPAMRGALERIEGVVSVEEL